ncbi:MAG: spore coat protein [Clostridiales bacterium]|uniref:spore coat protein n=1 Tax=Clostridium sp. N3C TaxID=1776758 RepID=UPI00092E0FBE|nr:spore coat protein [Clostridium sp. N3C]NLZ49185.1 spore coat protein [Clostridiales bacterium]SCN25114.1 Spore coat protein F precursor [Clostridium sp. N3C]
MSLLSSLFGSNNNSMLSEEEVASDILKDSKFSILALVSAATEAVNPDIRNMLQDQLDTAIKDHYELLDLLIRKGWYPAYDKPEDQLKKQGEEANSFK